MALSRFLRGEFNSPGFQALSTEPPRTCDSSSSECCEFWIYREVDCRTCGCPKNIDDTGCTSEETPALPTVSNPRMAHGMKMPTCPQPSQADKPVKVYKGEIPKLFCIQDCCLELCQDPKLHYFETECGGSNFSPKCCTQRRLVKTSEGYEVRYDGETDQFDPEKNFLCYIDRNEQKYCLSPGSSSEGNAVAQGNATATGETSTEILSTTRQEENGTVTDQIVYTYDESGFVQLLISAEHRRIINDGPAQSLSRALYTWYQDGDAHGGDGDLQTAVIQLFAADQQTWQDHSTSLYRWYAGQHLLKYAVRPAAYEQLINDPNVSDPLTTTDGMISAYADSYYEYDELDRVALRSVDAGMRTYTYQYDESYHPESLANWRYKRTETMPGGDQQITYSNHINRTLVKVLKSGDSQWIDFYQYDSEGRQILHANPSAVSGYDETYADLLDFHGGRYRLLRDHDGLIERTSYHNASNNVAGNSVQQGQLGNEIKLSQFEYTACDNLSTSVWFPSREIRFPSATDQSQTIETNWDYTFHPGTARIQQRTSTLPMVPVEQNGTGTIDTTTEVHDVHGRLTWSRNERGTIRHQRYDATTGSLAQTIEDFDTNRQGSDALFGADNSTIETNSDRRKMGLTPSAANRHSASIQSLPNGVCGPEVLRSC